MRVPEAADMSGVAHGDGATHVQSLLWPSSIAAEIETPGVCLVPESCAICTCTSARTDPAIHASMSNARPRSLRLVLSSHLLPVRSSLHWFRLGAGLSQRCKTVRSSAPLSPRAA